MNSKANQTVSTHPMFSRSPYAPLTDAHTLGCQSNGFQVILCLLDPLIPRLNHLKVGAPMVFGACYVT